MNLETLTLNDVRNLADSSRVYDRGYQYYSWDAVSKMRLSEDNHELTARVSGSSGKYHVKISDRKSANGEKLSAECDCPYDGLICKHIIATLIEFVRDFRDRDEDDEDEDWDDEEDWNDDEDWDDDDEEEEFVAEEAKSSTGSGTIPLSLQQTLEGMSGPELVALVLKLAGDSQEVLRLLLENVKIAPQVLESQPTNSDLVKKLKKDIVKYFRWRKQETDMIDNDYYYENHFDNHAGIEEVELEPILELAAALNPADRAAVYWYIVATAHKASSDYDVGEDVAEQAIRLYGEAVRAMNLPPEKREQHFDVLVSAMNWFAYRGLAHKIKEALDLIAVDTIDYHYLISILRRVQDSTATEWVAGYYLKLGETEKYLQIRKANLNREYQFLDLAEYWLGQNDLRGYVARLEKWLETLSADANPITLLHHQRGNYYFPVRQSFGEFLTGTTLKLLAQHYRENGDDTNLCRVLMAIARYGIGEISFDFALYQEIETVATRLGTWATQRESLLELAKAKPMELARIYIYEHNWEAAIELAMDKISGNSYWGANNVPTLVAEEIKDRRPYEAIKIYQKLMQSHIDQRGRKEYATAATYAAEIKEIYLQILKTPLEWASFIQTVRKENTRLRALQEEFKSL